ERGWKVPRLRQAVLDGQDGGGVVDVELRLERQTGQDGGIDIHEVAWHVVGQDMAAAAGAKAAIAVPALVVAAEQFLASGHLDLLRLPEREGIDRPGAPGPAVIAMAVAHGEGCAACGDFDGAAEAGTSMNRFLVGHDTLPEQGWRQEPVAGFRCYNSREVEQTSKSPAAPMPPPTHMVTTTWRAPRRRPSSRAWPTSRAP